MDLSEATDEELYQECRKRGLSILSDVLIDLWDNKEDEHWNRYKYCKLKR